MSLEVPRTSENANPCYFMFCLPERLQVAIEHALRSIRTFPIIAVILLETCYQASHNLSSVLV